MSSWTELRAILEDLRTDSRHPLQGYPNPAANDVRPPFRLRLQAWAEDIASDLYTRFGAQVDITVGSLHYPERRLLMPDGSEPRRQPEYPVVPPEQLAVSLDEPVAVPSGHNARSAMWFHNHQDHSQVVSTNGGVTGRVLDALTGTVVGGFAGAQLMPGIPFEVAAHESAMIPLLIGTASSIGELGYAIPPGEWAFDAIVTLEGSMYRTPPLPLTITP